MLVLLGSKGWVPARDGRVALWQFGRGKSLVYVPGLEEALLQGHGLSLALRWITSELLHGYRVTVVGRRESLPPGYTTRQMAADTVAALQAVKVQPVAVVGFGPGGLIARWMAADFPHACGALVLLGAPFNGKVPPNMARFFDHLAHLVRHSSWEEALDHAVSVYLGESLPRRLRPALKLVMRLGRPSGLERTLRQLAAFHQHEAAGTTVGALPVLTVSGGTDPLLPMDLAGVFRSARVEPTGHGPGSGSSGAPTRRRIWLHGEHSAILRHRRLVAAEIRRFVEELPPADPDLGTVPDEMAIVR